jgi:nucleotide-binding universal stress UspA family protein
METILICHDGSKLSDKALKKAFEIASCFGASVTVISVIPELYLTELMESDRERITETLREETKKTLGRIEKKATGLNFFKTVIKQGSPAEEIIAAAKKLKADLIVTGSHGRHGAEKFLLGSVSAKVVDHAPCSVLVVK